MKPAVFAYHRDRPEFYGVSIGVGPFVRPLYLYNKLLQLRDGTRDRLDSRDVTAVKIKGKAIAPCTSCQYFFNGGVNVLCPIGNCAEYDVLGIVRPDLRRGNKWNQFIAPCRQHFDAYRGMVIELGRQQRVQNQRDILERYFNNTRNPLTPRVLKYRLNSRRGRGFELCVENWPQPINE